MSMSGGWGIEVGSEREMGPTWVGGPPRSGAIRSSVRTRLEDLENEIASLEGDVLGLGDLLGPILEDPDAPAPKVHAGEAVPCNKVAQRVERAVSQIRWVRGLLQSLGTRVNL